MSIHGIAPATQPAGQVGQIVVQTFAEKITLLILQILAALGFASAKVDYERLVEEKQKKLQEIQLINQEAAFKRDLGPRNIFVIGKETNRDYTEVAPEGVIFEEVRDGEKVSYLINKVHMPSGTIELDSEEKHKEALAGIDAFLADSTQKGIAKQSLHAAFLPKKIGDRAFDKVDELTIKLGYYKLINSVTSEEDYRPLILGHGLAHYGEGQSARAVEFRFRIFEDTNFQKIPDSIPEDIRYRISNLIRIDINEGE